MSNPIKKLREGTGLDRRQFAIAAGVDYWTVTALELGYPAGMSPRTALHLASVAEITADELQELYRRWRELQQEAFLGEVRRNA